MAEHDYLDFVLRIEKKGEKYAATVVESPMGEATCTFRPPFSDLELENFVLKAAPSRRDIGVRHIRTPEMQATRRFGRKLFEAVFEGDVKATFVSSRQEASRQGMGLRVKLRLDAPELVNIPWEYLYDASQGKFLSLFEDTPVVRYMEMPGAVKPITVTPPLSVLVMVSSPTDCPQLDIGREKANLERAVDDIAAQGLISLTWVEHAKLPVLNDYLLRGRFHVFHYIGHSGFDERNQDGVLILEDDQGRGTWVSGERLAVLLGNHPSICLAVLNACEGARTSGEDPFAGAATTLVRTGGVPAVVAMQFAITDPAAITFARGFYTALSLGRPVDAAITRARLDIFSSGSDVEWGTPVLYLRAPDGRILDVKPPDPETLVADMVQRGRDHQDAGDWQKSVRSYGQALEMSPGHPGAETGLDQARTQLAAAEREARSKADELERQYARAAAAIEARDWAPATEHLEAIVSLDPDYRDAATLLIEARKASASEAAEREHQLTSLYAEAEAHRRNHEWTEAIESFRQLLDHQAGFKDAEEKLALVRRRQQLAEWYAKATEHVDEMRWGQAIECLREIIDMEPHYGSPSRGAAADLLARALQEKERAELPAPPRTGPRKPVRATDKPKPSSKPRDLPR